jgi:hypothetical protein
MITSTGKMPRMSSERDGVGKLTVRTWPTERESGVLLPLWKFEYDRAIRLQVTGLGWNSQRKDLFCVSYGTYDFGRPASGVLACFSLKNPSYPEFLFNFSTGCQCCHFHPTVSYPLFGYCQ